ncbi:MAG: hypothetical protein KJO91_00950, partial [Gammaproteobacteria bacterium]|nr:hypothetical protein [Gammaproteobacteria bacterium]
MPTRTRSPLRIFAYICLSVLFWYEKAYAAEQFVIIEVQPENSLVVLGKKYSVGDLIVIPNDTVVTLLGEDGSVTKVTGPATIKVTKDAIDRKSSDNSTAQITVGALSKISEFLLRSRPDEIVFGGTRTVQKGLSDPWVISIDGNGSGCFRDSAIGLRRLDARNRVTIALQFKEQPGEYLHTLAQQEFVVYLPPGLSEGRII